MKQLPAIAIDYLHEIDIARLRDQAESATAWSAIYSHLRSLRAVWEDLTVTEDSPLYPDIVSRLWNDAEGKVGLCATCYPSDTKLTNLKRYIMAVEMLNDPTARVAICPSCTELFFQELANLEYAAAGDCELYSSIFDRKDPKTCRKPAKAWRSITPVVDKIEDQLEQFERLAADGKDAVRASLKSSCRETLVKLFDALEASLEHQNVRQTFEAFDALEEQNGHE